MIRPGTKFHQTPYLKGNRASVPNTQLRLLLPQRVFENNTVLLAKFIPSLLLPIRRSLAMANSPLLHLPALVLPLGYKDRSDLVANSTIPLLPPILHIRAQYGYGAQTSLPVAPSLPGQNGAYAQGHPHPQSLAFCPSTSAVPFTSNASYTHQSSGIGQKSAASAQNQSALQPGLQLHQGNGLASAIGMQTPPAAPYGQQTRLTAPQTNFPLSIPSAAVTSTALEEPQLELPDASHSTVVAALKQQFEQAIREIREIREMCEQLTLAETPRKQVEKLSIPPSKHATSIYNRRHVRCQSTAALCDCASQSSFHQTFPENEGADARSYIEHHEPLVVGNTDDSSPNSASQSNGGSAELTRQIAGISNDTEANSPQPNSPSISDYDEGFSTTFLEKYRYSHHLKIFVRDLGGVRRHLKLQEVLDDFVPSRYQRLQYTWVKMARLII